MRILLILLPIFLAIPLFITGCRVPPNLSPTQTPTVTFNLSFTPTAAHVIDAIRGNFRNQISNLEENMPRANSERYVIPTKREQDDFAQLMSLLTAVDPASAAHLAVQNNYQLINYTDRGDDDAVSYVLREQRPVQKGWGLYALRVDSTSNIIIEAPHPLYDRMTPSVALNIYRALDARALLIAGAHRNANSDGSADVAHTPESIFHSVHNALAQEIKTSTGNVIILQIHGFHTSKHEGYPQAVFGFGEKLQGSELLLAKELESAFSAQGINVGLCTGYVWQDLCGTTNIQASVTNGGIFVHIELDEKLRRNDDSLVAALVNAFGTGSSP